MTSTGPDQRTPPRRGTGAFIALVVVALVAVVFVWFHTPVVHKESSGTSEGEFTTVSCSNAGPSRWKPPIAREGQEISLDPNMVTFSLQVMKNDLESIRVGLKCDLARDAHTNTLIVTTFAAGTAIFVGYVLLNRRRE